MQRRERRPRELELLQVLNLGEQRRQIGELEQRADEVSAPARQLPDLRQKKSILGSQTVACYGMAGDCGFVGGTKVDCTPVLHARVDQNVVDKPGGSGQHRPAASESPSWRRSTGQAQREATGSRLNSKRGPQR